jgi:hypothetical protein
VIDIIVFDVESLSGSGTDSLKTLLLNILQLPPEYRGTGEPTFSVLSRFIISGQMGGLPQDSWNSPRWLCTTLSATVSSNIYKERRDQLLHRPRRYSSSNITNDEFEDWLNQKQEPERRSLDELIQLFEAVKTKHFDQPWPTSPNPRSIDRELHLNFVRDLDKQELDFQRHVQEREKMGAMGRKAHAFQNAFVKVPEKGLLARFPKFRFDPDGLQVYERFEEASVRPSPGARSSSRGAATSPSGRGGWPKATR